MEVSKTAWHALSALAFYERYFGSTAFVILTYPPAIGGYFLTYTNTK